MYKSIYLFLSLLILFIGILFYNKEIEFFDIIELEKSTGARCLDGSPYTFFIKKGSGDGINNFLIFFDGGGWCSKKVYNSTLSSCWKRKQTYLGSSNISITQIILNFIGKYPFFKRWGYILSSDSLNNPNFNNWNKVFLNYCDGRGFLGFNNDEISDGKDLFYFRGFNNTIGAINYLSHKMNFKTANKVIISGASAGGVASLTYSNFIADYLPNSDVRTISDSGFILDYENKINPYYNFSVVWKDLIKDTKPNFEPLLKTYCNEKDEWKCFLPEYFYKNIRVPVFLIHSQYDIYGICNLIGANCNFSLTSFNINNVLNSEDHREKFVKSIMKVKDDKKDWGIWSPACYLHDFVMYSFQWKKRLMNNTNLKEAISNWYNMDNENNFYIDKDAWPNNKECAYTKDLMYYIQYFKINTDIY